MALKPRDPFEEEQVEEPQDPKIGDKVRIMMSSYQGVEGYVARVYKNDHILAAFRPSAFDEPVPFIRNRNGWYMLRLMPGEFEIFDRRIYH